MLQSHLFELSLYTNFYDFFDAPRKCYSLICLSCLCVTMYMFSVFLHRNVTIHLFELSLYDNLYVFCVALRKCYNPFV